MFQSAETLSAESPSAAAKPIADNPADIRIWTLDIIAWTTIGAGLVLAVCLALPGCSPAPENSTGPAPIAGAAGNTAAPPAGPGPEEALGSMGTGPVANQDPPRAPDDPPEDPVVVVPALASPKSVPAAEATVSDDAEVIGFVLDGQPRAFVCDAMRSDDARVITDLIGTTPVFVTYCQESDMARVFSQAPSGPAATVAHAGLRGDELQLVVNGTTYPQSSTNIPLADVDFVKTLWIAWKDEHQETLVFPGESERLPADQP